MAHAARTRARACMHRQRATITRLGGQQARNRRQPPRNLRAIPRNRQTLANRTQPHTHILCLPKCPPLAAAAGSKLRREGPPPLGSAHCKVCKLPTADADFKNYNRASSPPPFRCRKCESAGLWPPAGSIPIFAHIARRRLYVTYMAGFIWSRYVGRIYGTYKARRAAGFI